jgi:ElaB/YqjD/DUF883 family membrane-anchored ribosome-binding protein
MTTTPGGTGGSAASGRPAAGASAYDPDAPEDLARLREDIEHTRRELGDTVDALVAKTDVRARAQEKARQARATAQEKLQNVRDRAEELGTQARQSVTARGNTPGAKGGAVAVAGVAAACAGIWAWRRRRRPRTPWERALYAARPVALKVYKRLGEMTRAALNSDPALRAAERARQIAADPETRPRAQGAGAAVGAMVVLTILRRAARRMPEGR